MKYEYHEGPKALENFKAGMSQIFKAPKVALKDLPKSTPKRGKASKG
jgi:hypothetical protein